MNRKYFLSATQKQFLKLQVIEPYILGKTSTATSAGLAGVGNLFNFQASNSTSGSGTIVENSQLSPSQILSSINLKNSDNIPEVLNILSMEDPLPVYKTQSNQAYYFRYEIVPKVFDPTKKTLPYFSQLLFMTHLDY